MSAPDAKLGELSHETVMSIVQQLIDCGVREVSLTGGEPLVRKDFMEIVDALLAGGIHISTIYSNGKLVTDQLLDDEKLTERLRAATEYEDVFALAKELGIELTMNDVEPVPEPDELTEDELNTVTGGCFCLLAGGGGGKSSSETYGCACVAFGIGYIAEDSKYPYYRGKARCCCPMGGSGDAAEEFVTFCNCGGVTY